MFMETVDAVVGDNRVRVYLYKHDMTREYVNVDENGRLYMWAGDDTYQELSVEEARGRLVGGLVHALEEGVDISRDMSEVWQRLADLTGLAIRAKTPEPK
ncbi:hypothetical protein CFM90_26430 (plasmid) [Ralstonia solanacearum]|nr:hypothetical protein CFM90_26430 [Ralstonia solanacearum]